MQVLVRTVDLGSLSAAACELGTTQPAVSKIAVALERELAVRLVERTTPRLTPTEADLRCYEHAKPNGLRCSVRSGQPPKARVSKVCRPLPQQSQNRGDPRRVATSNELGAFVSRTVRRAAPRHSIAI